MARVFLADDNDVLRRVFAKALRAQGYEVIEIRDGKEFLARIADLSDEEAKLDLIVTDLDMPVVTGGEILSMLREVRWGVPVIVITGGVSATVRSEIGAMGATLLEKPVPLANFVAACRSAIGRKPGTSPAQGDTP